MKFLIVLALVALASANLNYNLGRRSYGGSLLSSRSSYGSGLSGLSLGGGYGGSYGSGLSGLSIGSGLSGGYSSGLSGGYSSGLGLGNAKLALIQAVPVSLASQQVSIAQPSLSLGLGSSYGGSYGASYGASQQLSGPITAAIQSTRNVQVVDVASNQQAAAPAQIVIGPSVQPIDIEFQSQSSPVSVRQTHIPGQANAPQVSSHQEEPDYLKQEIVKPVIHEVTEAIQPYRKVTQEVRPVLETINQLITRGQQQQTVYAQGQGLGLGSTQFVQSAPSVAVSAQPTLALVTSAQPVSVGLTGSQGYGSGLSLGGSYGGSLLGSSLGSSGLSLGSSSLGYGSSLGSSSLGYGSSLGGSSLGSSLGYGSLSGSTLVSKPSSVSVSSVDNYRRA